MASLTIEQWPIGRLIPYENNPRKNDDAVPRMVTVIREFGFRVPVLAKSTGDLVDGHLRLKAAMVLGLDTVPVITVDDMSLEQVRAFRIMINRSATWADWDDEALLRELQALQLASYDLSLTGFDQRELDEMLMQLDESTDKDPDDIPEPPDEPQVRDDEVWLLGRHRLMCGDSTSRTDMRRLMGEDLADMIWTDPPYNVDYSGNNTGDRCDNGNNGNDKRCGFDDHHGEGHRRYPGGRRRRSAGKLRKRRPAGRDRPRQQFQRRGGGRDTHRQGERKHRFRLSA